MEAILLTEPHFSDINAMFIATIEAHMEYDDILVWG